MGFFSNKFDYEYYFPTRAADGQYFVDNSTISVSNETPVPVTVGTKSLYTLSFTDTSIYFQFTKTALWMTGLREPDGVTRATFNGPVFHDSANLLSDIVGATMKTNIAGLIKRDLTFDKNHIWIDFRGISSDKLSYVWLTVKFNDPIIGNNDDNLLRGNRYDNVMSGLKGDDRMFGLSGADTMNGGEGNDYISGGSGNDILTGGPGSDTFVFDAAPHSEKNVDTITDFSVKDDLIALDRSIFGKIGTGSTVSDSAFHIGAAAHDTADRIIYDDATGNLYYDADGSGSRFAAVQFATISKGLALTADNFLLIP